MEVESAIIPETRWSKGIRSERSNWAKPVFACLCFLFGFVICRFLGMLLDILTVSLSSVLRASTKNSSTVAGSCQWHIPSIAAAWCYFDLSNVSVTVHERPPHTPWITQTVPRFGEDLKGAGGREATVASCAKLVQLLQDLRSCFAWPKLAKQVAFDGSMRIDTFLYTFCPIYIHFAK